MAPRSRAQLAEKLAARDVPDEVASEVLDRFEDVGLVDDARYAEGFVNARQGQRGRRALALELRRKGVDDETAREAVDAVDDASEEAAARRLVQRKLAATRGLDRVVRQRRLAGALARRGFPPGLVMSVVREELAADEVDQVDEDELVDGSAHVPGTVDDTNDTDDGDRAGGTLPGAADGD